MRARLRPRLAGAVALPLAALSLALAPAGPPVAADSATVSGDLARDGWDPAEPALSSTPVSTGGFGPIFNTPVSGQQYAQPLVIGSAVIASTMRDMVYSVNAVTGAINWQRQLGTPEPMSVIGCGDITDVYGIMATPVYDASSRTVYELARTWDGANAASARYQMHALDLATGNERQGWPVTISGAPTNDPTTTFDPTVENARVGLTLLNGYVYAAYASFCDAGGYRGYVSSTSTAGGTNHLWSSEAGSTSPGGGIWQSGGGLMSDGAGRLFVSVGNGDPPPVGPGTTASPFLGNSVVRLTANVDGTLSHADHFAPADAAALNAADKDLGSSAPVALPDGMGVPGHPHLLVTGSKAGVFFVLDRDNLGGEAQGAGGANADVAEVNLNQAVFSHPSVWPGDGGWIYSGATVLKIGNGGGVTSIAPVATFANSSGYRGGSAIVTSNGTASGSALVWTLAQPVTGTGPAYLRAYGAVPSGGVLPMLWQAAIGQADKFNIPVSSNGRVYVGTYDGRLLGYGPVTPWTVNVPPSGGTGSSFTAVSALATADAWAVGSYRDGGGASAPLSEHWDGLSWNMVVPPKGGVASTFNAVAARAAGDVWAAGSYDDGAGGTWPLLERWLGSGWNVVVPPRGGNGSAFTGITAVGVNDVWAVGWYQAGATRWPLTEHWDGTGWNVVVPPGGGVAGTFDAVSARATGDVWAAGSYDDGAGGTWPLVEHWDGAAWNVVVPPRGGSSSAFTSISERAPGDLWATGWYLAGASRRPLAEHFDGTAWTVLPGITGGASSVFNSVSAVGPSDVWTVGTWFDGSGNANPLSEHWDGLQWSLVLPVRGGVGSGLNGIATIATNDIWAVGSYTDAAGAAHPLGEHHAALP